MPANLHAGSTLVRVEFDRLEPPSHSRLHVRPGSDADLDDVYALIAKHVPAPYAPIAVFRRILGHHPETLLVFRRGSGLLGFHAALYLSPLGLEQLLLGKFDGLSPEPRTLAEPAATPAAIYHWLTICPGLAVARDDARSIIGLRVITLAPTIPDRTDTGGGAVTRQPAASTG